MSTPYRPPMAKSDQQSGSQPRESRTWNSQSSSSNPVRRFDDQKGYHNNRPSAYHNDRPSAYHNDRPSAYRSRFTDRPESSQEKPIPKNTSEQDFPSLTPQPKIARPQVPWSQLATPKPVTDSVTQVTEKPASGWSNVVVKMESHQAEIEAQKAEELQIQREKERNQAQLKEKESKHNRVMQFHVPLPSGFQSTNYDEEDEYIPSPAYGNQTPLDDDDYDYDTY